MPTHQEIIARLERNIERVRKVNAAASKEKRIREVGDVESAAPAATDIQQPQPSQIQGVRRDSTV